MLVSGALDDTKKMRKAGADIFAKSGPEKNPKHLKQNQDVPGIFLRFSCGLSLNPVNSRTNGWEPFGSIRDDAIRWSVRYIWPGPALVPEPAPVSAPSAWRYRTVLDEATNYGLPGSGLSDGGQ